MKTPRSRAIVAGIALIALGLGIWYLKDQEVGAGYLLVLVGGIFTASYFFSKSYGYLVPGCLMLALWLPGLDPTAHAYPAMMWSLVVWTSAHVGAGVVMQGYCLAGCLVGKLTPRYDADLVNTTLFWHFI